jgi:hypothetical protein
MTHMDQMKQKQTKCQVNNQLIRWRKFLQLTNKLKIPKVIWTKEDGAKMNTTDF